MFKFPVMGQNFDDFMNTWAVVQFHLWFNFLFQTHCIPYCTKKKRERNNILNHNDKTEPKHIHVHCTLYAYFTYAKHTARSSVFHSYEEVWKVDYGPLHVCKFSLPPPPPSSSISLTPSPPSPPAPTILNNKFNS